MNDASTRHPAADRLAAYRAGQLSAVEAAQVVVHLTDCAECRAAAAVLAGETMRPESDTAEPQAPPTAGTPPPDAAAEPPGKARAAAAQVPPTLVDHPRYHVLKLLGVGGMGSVFKAEHRVMERLVALKVLNRDLVADSDALKRFRQEVRAAARLNHPNIVTAHDADESGGVHFLVMEYVEGQSLAEFIDRNGRMTVPRACECIRQAAVGLQHAFEKGMVHRDIKPQNLMIGAQGRVKILDFGLARFASERSRGDPAAESQRGLTQTGAIMGTPDYMAPEQATDARRADIRADIYSLGCTLFHLLAGEPPFPDGGALQKVVQHLEKAPRSLSDVRAEVSRELAAVVARMLAKDPAKRYQTPAEVAKALAPFIKLSGSVTPRPAPAPVPKPAKSGSKPIVVPVPKAEAIAPEVPIVPLKPIRPREVNRKDNPFEQETPLPKAAKSARKGPTPWYLQKPVWLAAVGLIVMLWLGVSILTSDSDKPTKGPGENPIGAAAVGVTATAATEPQRTSVARVETSAPIAPVGPTNIPPVQPTSTPTTTSPASPQPTVQLKLEGHQAPVNGAVFSPDGRSVLSWSADRTLRLWDAVTGLSTRTYDGHTEEVMSAVFYPEGKRFISAGFDGTVRLWDVQETKPVISLGTQLGRLHCVALQPQGKIYLAAGEGRDNAIFLGNALTPIPIGALTGHQGGVAAAVFSPSGQQIYSASYDKTVRVWDVAQLRQIKELPHDAPVQSLALSRDGRFLLTGTRDGVARLWDTTTDTVLHRTKPYSTLINGLAFSSNGRFALVASGGTGVAPAAFSPGSRGALTWWDTQLWKELWTYEVDSGPVMSATLSGDERSALVGHWDRTARLWKLPAADAALLKTDAPRAAQLVIESEEPAARVVVKREGKTVAGPTAQRLLELSPGDYEIDWPEPQPLMRLSTVRFHLVPGGQLVVKIQRLRLAWPDGGVAAPDLTKLKPQAEYDLRSRKSGLPDGPQKAPGASVVLGYGSQCYSIDMRKPANIPAIWGVPLPAKPSREFACEVLGRVSASNVAWGMRLLSPKQDRIIDVALEFDGDMVVRRIVGESSKPIAGPFKVAGLKAGSQFNAILIVLRGRFLEVFVNGRSVCDPITLETGDVVAEARIHTEGSIPSTLHAEFQRVKLWAADKLPTAQSRGAVVR